ncbi:acyl-CoA reductase [Pseudomonas sp. SZMC_28357]|uniref:acyl-CoA reductase n=1 Tax=Pseudomonas sp. SZMC_28357 TaxID=3074380 RepID=UPI0028714B60|nr:acyl-CoA reductase [Pseudomonas sp. SZMC_28357]MDR9753647.1 acyl-CoA reductase [Pseudomonas sp. SZMC_28357]
MYLINGQLHTAMTAEGALDLLRPRLATQLMLGPQTEALLSCAQRFAERLAQPSCDLPLDPEQRQMLIAFCQRRQLSAKLERELGDQPHSTRRIHYRSSHFESWQPLGLVLHLTPSNAPLLAFLAVLEGLLAGNINWLRPSSSDAGFSARLLAAWLAEDPSGQLADCVAVLPVGTAQIPLLSAHADGVSAWGGDAALKAIREQLPMGCRWIDWGHKLSLAYVCPQAASGAAFDALIDEVCQLDQQACSSPQCVLVDSEDPQVLQSIGEQLAEAFVRRHERWPSLLPSPQESSEISTRVSIARLQQSFAGQPGQVWSGDGWRVMWEHSCQLAPSPLFRTLLVRPAPLKELSSLLLPWRTRLQSCALIVAPSRTADIARSLLLAGICRITTPGAIHDGYAGEPHDGVYALTRLSRRVSVSLPGEVLSHRASLDCLRSVAPALDGEPILDKPSFMARSASDQAQIFFRSGGSSGTPALAGFSYRDFNRQMRAVADGLFALGLNPGQDRVANLFYGANLYGGLASFSKILEQMGVTQYPIGAPLEDDFSEIAELIVSQRVNTLIGMPSTLQRLFSLEQSRLNAYGGLRKVYLSGEHVSEAIRPLMQACGVNVIRSAIYGSVDAGPLGHACPATSDGTFHLLTDAQYLEIVDLQEDTPVAAGEVGRLIFTSLAREGQQVRRYEVGDSGRWVPGACPCGLDSPRFELHQRHGKWLRITSEFISSSELLELAGGAAQIVLDYRADGGEHMQFNCAQPETLVRERLLQHSSLALLVNTGLLTLEVRHRLPTEFVRNAHSGKVPYLLDRRLHNTAIDAGAAQP